MHKNKKLYEKMNTKEMCFLWVILIRTHHSKVVDKCSSGKFQSPILIGERPRKFSIGMTDRIKDYYGDSLVFKDFQWSYHSLFVNENKSYELFFEIPKGYSTPSVSGGPLGNDTFYLHKILFHWNFSSSGSSTEHTFVKRQYEGEVQFIIYNSRYKNFENASRHESDGLAAFAAFIKSINGYSSMDILAKKLTEKITSNTSKWKITEISPAYFLPEQTEAYVMYKGSLTTPPCTEIVTWILFSEPIFVNDEHFENLKAVLPGPNPRVPQNLNERRLYMKLDAFSYEIPKNLKEEIFHWKPRLYDKLIKDFTPLNGEKTISYCYKSYHCEYHPPKWKEVYPECGGNFQSPINIDLSQVKTTGKRTLFPRYSIKVGATFLPVIIYKSNLYIYYPEHLQAWEVKNQLNEEIYVLNRIKILIGNENGSEHSINNKFYPIEIQFFNINKKFGNNVKQALEHPDGVFVISKFFDISEDSYGSTQSEREEFKKIIPSLTYSFRYFSAKSLREEMFIQRFLDINKLLGEPSEVFIYNGSLSEPPCNKLVTWLIIEKPSMITREDFSKIMTEDGYRSLSSGKDFEGVNEKRPIQEAEGRDVYMEPYKLQIIRKVETFRNENEMVFQAGNKINFVVWIYLSICLIIIVFS